MAETPRDSHERLAYLLRLADQLRLLADPLEMQRCAAQLLGEHLEAQGTCFAEARGGRLDLQVTSEWRSTGGHSLVGHLRLEQFGRRLGRPVRNGTVICIADVRHDDGIDPVLHEAWEAQDVRAAVFYPVVRENRLVAALLVYQSTVRNWTDAEIAMVTETGERVADAIAHARALETERMARTAADRAVFARDQVLATLAHELRTPLASILSWTQLLQARFLTDERMLRTGLAVINDSALMQRRLLTELQDSNRMVSGKILLSLEPLDLNDLVTSVCAALRPAADAGGVALSCHLGETAAPLLADGVRLRQVLMNLLCNAIRFTPQGGRVEVGVHRLDGAFEIRVIDTGEGIAPELLPLIFERFRQGDSARSRAHAGLGLGLSVARQIVELHAGTIDAKSAGIGHGACFTVRLPVRLADELAGIGADATRGLPEA